MVNFDKEIARCSGFERVMEQPAISLFVNKEAELCNPKGVSGSTLQPTSVGFDFVGIRAHSQKW